MELFLLLSTLEDALSSGKDALDPTESDKDEVPVEELDLLAVRIRAEWMRTALSVTPSLLARWVRHYQQKLVHLIDLTKRSGSGSKEARNDVYKDLILSLLDELFLTHSQEMDGRSLVPFMYLEYWRCRNREGWIELKGRMAQLSMPVELFKTLDDHLSAIITGPAHKVIRFRELLYTEQMIGALIQVCIDNNNELCTDDLTEILLSLNYNNLGFLLFLQAQVQTRINDRAGHASTLLILEDTYNAIVHTEEFHDGLAFNADWPPIRIMFKNWLSEKIDQCRATAQIVVEEQRPTKKVPLDLPVPHIACLIRAFSREDIFKGTDLRSIFSALANGVQSKKATMISAKSISKEYYSVSQTTAARVIDLLQRSAATLKKEFFPLIFIGLGLFAT